MKTRLLRLVPAVGLLFAASTVIAQQGTTVGGTVMNVNWGPSRVTFEVQVFEPTGRPIRSFVEATLNTPGARGIPRNVIQRGDNVVACGSSRTRPDGAPSIAADLIVLQDGRRLILAANGARACVQAVNALASSAATRGARGSVPAASSPVQPMLNPPIEAVVTSPVQPMASNPVLPLGSPRNGTTRSATATGQAPQRIPLDAIDLSYLQLYDRDRPMQLSGRVTRVDWTQPNTYVYLVAGGAQWVVESSFTQFRQVAASPAIRIGDTITVSGYMPQDNPIDQLPAKTDPTIAPYLRSNHLIRAGEITIFTGQKLGLGDPPTREELARQEKCSYFLGC